MQPELPSTARESTTARPPLALVPRRPPPLPDRWALTDTTIAKTVAKRGLGWCSGSRSGTLVEKRGGTPPHRGAGWDVARQQGGGNKKREKTGKDSIPKQATESFWGETKPRSGLGLVARTLISPPPAWQDANGTPITLTDWAGSALCLCLAQSARGVIAGGCGMGGMGTWTWTWIWAAEKFGKGSSASKQLFSAWEQC